MIFKKKDLEEKLGLNKEDRKVIMKFQKQLPILTEDENMKVDARELHKQLGVGKVFGAWIVGRIKKYNFKENEDYLIEFQGDIDDSKIGNVKKLSPQQRSRYGITQEYLLSLDMAKELCMVENNENGRISRKYFILMEKAIKEMIRWNKIREPEKESYKQMCIELDKYFQRNFNKRPHSYDYSNEADSLNLVCLGARAKDILKYFNAQDNNTREHLLSEYNVLLDEIQKLNMMYLKMNIDKNRRYDLIKQGFKVTYPHATYIFTNSNVNEREVI